MIYLIYSETLSKRWAVCSSSMEEATKKLLLSIKDEITHLHAHEKNINIDLKFSLAKEGVLEIQNEKR